MASLTPCGMPSRGDAAWPVGVRRPSCASRRTTSPKKRGFPSVCALIAVTRLSGTSAPAARRMKWATSSRASPAIGSTRVTDSRRRATSVSVSGLPRASSVSRYPATTRMRVSASSRARNCSRIRDGVSAACRSSSTSTSGSLMAARLRNAAVESNRRKRAVSGSCERDGAGTPATRSRTSGTSSATSAAALPSSAASSSGLHVLTYARIDWHHGQ